MEGDEYRDGQGRTFSEAVADEVMAAIIASGKSMREVARESGISRTRLHGRLHNDRPFNTNELASVAAALGVEPWRFVRGDWD